MPHGDLAQVFTDVFFVTGTARPVFNGAQFQFSRNMIVLREDNELTIVNSVRLSDDGLTALDALGTVVNVVKLGSFHGMDDAFYLDRYSDAKLWALPGMTHESGHATDCELTPNNAPIRDCAVFVYETSKTPEALLLFDREGGVLISCDSLQNWVQADRFFSPESVTMMTEFGFIRPANIGPGWFRAAEPQLSDFERVKALSFQHLVPAHGSVLRDDAHRLLSATFEAAFSTSS